MDPTAEAGVGQEYCFHHNAPTGSLLFATAIGTDNSVANYCKVCTKWKFKDFYAALFLREINFC